MKFKILVLSILINIAMMKINMKMKDDSVIESDNRDNREKNNKPKKIRQGSMTEGYILPGFYLTDLNNLKAQQVQTFISPNTKFHPQQLENPKTDFEKIGLIFSFEKFDPSLSTLMFPTDKKNEYYLPFRFIKSNPIFRASWFFWTNKSIEMVIANDQNNTFSFYIVFPYKYLGAYITDADGIKLAALIGEKKEKEIRSVKENLMALKKKANEIINKNQIIIKSKDEIQTLDSQKTSIISKVETLKKTVATINSELSVNEKSLELYKSKRTTLDQSLQGLTSQLKSYDMEIKSNEELVKSLSNAQTIESNKQLNAKLKEELVSEDKDIKGLIEALKKLMPDKISSISSIETSYNKENGINNIEKFLLSVTPRISTKNEKVK